MSVMRNRLIPLLALLLVTATSARQNTPAPISYTLAFPAAEHHVAEVEITFSGVPAGTLQARMSRSSPGTSSAHSCL